MTFERLVQSSLEDIAYAQRIGRLRDFYVTVAPELVPYVLVVHVAGDLVAGAIVGAAALSLQRCHHCRARDAYTPEGVDRAAIVVPPRT